MTSLQEFGIPGVGFGILHPTMSHQFRFRIGEGNQFNLLTAQTTRIYVNMVKGEIKVWVEQPAAHAQTLLDMIGDLAKFDYVAFIDMLDGAEGVTAQIKCYSKLVDHELVLDYAQSGIATHVLTFNYTKAH
jgi:hypothetical protein